MISWAWASAACRGTSHHKTGIRLQDALASTAVKTPSQNFFLGVISDGAGSADLGGEGASIVCRTLFVAAREYLRDSQSLPSDSVVEFWVDKARDRISYSAEKRGLAGRDYAATLVCILTDGVETLIVHVGDGCVVIKDEIANKWIAPSWPEHGEFASTTYFVTDEAELSLRLTRFSGPISAVALFSDGLERLALDFSMQVPFDGFFNGMIKPLIESKIIGKDATLSKSLKKYLDSDAINARTDDDKSLIIALKHES
jgi:hypothetical protein